MQIRNPIPVLHKFTLDKITHKAQNELSYG